MTSPQRKSDEAFAHASPWSIEKEDHTTTEDLKRILYRSDSDSSSIKNHKKSVKDADLEARTKFIEDDNHLIKYAKGVLYDLGIRTPATATKKQLKIMDAQQKKLEDSINPLKSEVKLEYDVLNELKNQINAGRLYIDSTRSELVDYRKDMLHLEKENIPGGKKAMDKLKRDKAKKFYKILDKESDLEEAMELTLHKNDLYKVKINHFNIHKKQLRQLQGAYAKLKTKKMTVENEFKITTSHSRFLKLFGDTLVIIDEGVKLTDQIAKQNSHLSDYISDMQDEISSKGVYEDTTMKSLDKTNISGSVEDRYRAFNNEWRTHGPPIIK